MTLEQLRIFVAVAERLHMTRAAKALHLTQSAVSAAVTALETRYDTKLFDRIGRGLALTATGEALVPHARAVLASSEEAKGLLADMAGLRRGTISIYASQTVAAYWLPTRMAAFKARYPDIVLNLQIANTHRVIEAVAGAEAELGLIEGQEEDPRLERTVVGADQLIVAASPDHPMAQSKQPLGARDLAALHWALREKGSGTRSAFEAHLPSGLSASDLQIALTLPSNEAILTAVATHPLVTAISELAARPLIEAGRLVQLSLDLPRRPFYRLHHKERTPSRATEAFIASF